MSIALADFPGKFPVLRPNRNSLSNGYHGQFKFFRYDSTTSVRWHVQTNNLSSRVNMPSVVQSDQFQIVQELIRRQDDVLDRLDELNRRLERAIEEVNAFRDVDVVTDSESGESPEGISGERPKTRRAA